MPASRDPTSRTLARLGALAALLVSSAAGAAPAPKGITGMWLLTPTEYARHETMPLTPEGQAFQEKRRKATEDGGQVLSASSRKCLPIGMPGFMTNEFALEILESPGRVTMLSENSTLPRSVYLTETSHPKGLEPSWNGHSIGRWEGKVLLVETVNFNDRVGPVTGSGVHSPTTRLTERYYLKDPDTLVGEMTFEDPKYLAKPWTSTHSYQRLPPGAELWEYACEVDAAGWSERFDGDPDAKIAPKAE
jgi:hypothetical protein